ncbi:hypothetical protein L1999_14170 [Neobacillus drentensis]|uniref:hypothetical protein n=1 Tax=Neobacillus drentensis TaxID=220684 RepID=UPI001F25B968|nr:hypothetical protein [Neobacillus drentensis]ULT59594.1 hypothetical protein L1999_14170 [Neobacillus drentensis]
MGRDLLTLAISQYNNHEYILICYDQLKIRLLSIELHRNEIESNGDIYFDLGSVTEVEDLREVDISYPVGEKKLKSRFTREQLKKFFEREKVNIEAFKLNKNIEKYAIIKISLVEDFYIKDHKLRLKFWTSGVRNDYLVKDDRWVNYYQNNCTNSEFLKKLNNYKNLFNHKQRSAFAILYKFQDYDAVWIAGLHLL